MERTLIEVDGKALCARFMLEWTILEEAKRFRLHALRDDPRSLPLAPALEVVTPFSWPRARTVSPFDMVLDGPRTMESSVRRPGETGEGGFLGHQCLAREFGVESSERNRLEHEVLSRALSFPVQDRLQLIRGMGSRKDDGSGYCLVVRDPWRLTFQKNKFKCAKGHSR